MAHHVYQTDAFILRGADTGDANKYIDIFTKELGFIRASAQGVRKEKSKLRYSLQDHTYSKVALVRGKEIWRVTGATEYHSNYYKFKENKEKLLLFIHISSLLRRLLHGEERNEYLFNIFKSFTEYLRAEDIDDNHLKALEYLTVLRILHNLGYIPDKEQFFDDEKISKDLLNIVLTEKTQIVSEINHALKVSHL